MSILKSLSVILIFLISNFSFSQVGIGTTSPDASSVLDVTAIDKGVLIPRVSLPNIATTMLDGINTAATGLLIYNTNATVTGGNGVGYYYFNGTIWEQLSTISTSNDHDFYEEGTTNAPNSINDDMFTHGHVAIGKSTADYALDVEEVSARRAINVNLNASSNADHSGVYIRAHGSGTGFRHGIFNDMSLGDGLKYGVRNELSGAGQVFNGVLNNMTGSGSGIYQGVNNFIDASGTGDKFGCFTRNSGRSEGDIYGVYSSVSGSSGLNFSGFFVGDFAIGTRGYNSVTPNYYILPPSRGTANQIMQTDAAGNVSWINPSTISTDNQNISGSGLSGTDLTIGIENGTSETVDLSSFNDHDWYEEGSTNAPNSVNDNIFTQGNVAIGKTTANYALDIIEDTGIRAINASLTSSDNLVTSVLRVENANSGNLGKRGVFTEFTGNSDGDKSCIYNYYTNTGSGNQTGVSNWLRSTSNSLQRGIVNYIDNSGNGYHYGVWNTLTGTGSGEKYGSYYLISSTAGGQHYGVYSSVLKSSGYAGYFLGRVAIGTMSTDRYIFPSSRGTNGQIMQTNAVGQLSWVDTSTFISASNGLTDNAGNIEFGGSLSQATTITQGTNNLIFNLDSTGDFIIQDNGSNHFEVRDSGDAYFGGDNYWNDGLTGGTNLASLTDEDNDARFRLCENGVPSVDLNTNTGFVFNAQGFDRDFRIASDNETSMFRVDAGNNRIGIMEATPNFDIHLKQSSNTEGGVGGMGFESSATTNNWKIYHSGANFSFAENGVRRAYIATTSGLYMDTSDRRLKKNITEVESILEKVIQLEAYRYLYKDQDDSGKKILGFIAQDVQPLFPELVGQSEDDFLALNYAGFGVVAIKAIQEQQDIIDAQQKQIENLQKEKEETHKLLEGMLKRIENLESKN